MSNKNIRKLVLDAGPLITESASTLQQYAQEFYTTPGVHGELKDDQVRNKLLLWNDNLKIRHPKLESIKKVEAFAKLTGDYLVLSANDIHIIALAYELEVEENGTWRLRNYPGEKIDYSKGKKPSVEGDKKVEEGEKAKEDPEEKKDADEGFTTVGGDSEKKKKPRRRGGKKQREKRELQLQKELDDMENLSEKVDKLELESTETKQEVPTINPEDLSEEFNEEEDDGDWITPDNLQEEMLKDNNEEVQESTKKGSFIKVALATGDFACQNVTMQMGMNLMNAMSGKQIKRIRNYMYRCHACFRLTPIPKSGTPKHFCPKCGGNTLLRCAVSIDNVSGKVTPHLKANFQWIKRGTRFSLPSPLSKNQQKRAGNGGYQHNKENRHKTLQDPLILTEDQKEYQRAVKDDEWQRRQNDKLLQEWIGGGSADNFISPFNSIQTMRPSGVKVGRGRYVNSSRGKRK